MDKKIRRNAVLLMLLTFAVCGQAFALHHNIARRPQKTGIRRAHLRRLRWNPLFRPSRDSLLRQNQEIDRLEVSDRYTDWRESRMLAGEPPEQAESEAMPSAAGGGNSQ